MKKISFNIILCVLVLACKSEAKQEVNLEENRSKSYDQNDGFITIKGDFVFDEAKNAAVIQKNDNTVYSVVVDDNMKLLEEQVKPLKTDIYDMVNVTIRVKKLVNTDKSSAWPYMVEIKEILKVEAPDTNKDDVIKLAN
ncbi:hypothetical protein [Winogradskyella sp.]|uniref:hypothetical protein n=1 Tax=Winogradskyella sp. TaxID=1883156 RepID=UPI003F6B337F